MKRARIAIVEGTGVIIGIGACIFIQDSTIRTYVEGAMLIVILTLLFLKNTMEQMLVPFLGAATLGFVIENYFTINPKYYVLLLVIVVFMYFVNYSKDNFRMQKFGHEK